MRPRAFWPLTPGADDQQAAVLGVVAVAAITAAHTPSCGGST
ncbi:MAG TPA: hypothetical protein VHG70_17325 [Nocardioidaceae bacterium]|nr:hypothetical protein [Nocardioidaceae bacterium]